MRKKLVWNEILANIRRMAFSRSSTNLYSAEATRNYTMRFSQWGSTNLGFDFPRYSIKNSIIYIYAVSNLNNRHKLCNIFIKSHILSFSQKLITANRAIVKINLWVCVSVAIFLLCIARKILYFFFLMFKHSQLCVIYCVRFSWISASLKLAFDRSIPLYVTSSRITLYIPDV